LKNAVAHYNAGAVAVSSKVVGLAPGHPVPDLICDEQQGKIKLVLPAG
jgi:hypothetical protein